jgi:dephospho-CoA kinase
MNALRMPTIDELPTLWLLGAICSGKDTIAKELNAVGFKTVSISLLIAEEIAERMNITVEEAYRRKDELRTLWQDIGTERRTQDKNYWINKLVTRMNDGKYVMASARFCTESTAAMSRGDFVLKVLCDEPTRQERIKKIYPSLTAANANHAAESEIELAPYHATIYGTLKPKDIIPAIQFAFWHWTSVGRPVIVPGRSHGG